MAKVNWGIIGCGNIAHTFAKSIAHCADAQLIGAASTSLQRANEFATHYSIKGYESYQALMQCPNIDAIYIANTHEQHFKSVAQCLTHNKHVLSEKPITVNAQQLITLKELAQQQNRFLMEGVWMRFLPAIVKLQQLLSEGVIGKVHSVNANFSLAGEFESSHRLMNPATAGGALLDLGIYPISIADVVFNKTPEQIKSLVHKSTTGVDERSVTLINYGQGQFAQLSSALQQNGPTQACILGEYGYIRIDEFVGAQSLELHLNAQQMQRFDFSFNDDENFKFEIDHVSECILQQQTQSSVLPLSTSLRVMNIMDELRAQWQLKYSDSVESNNLN
ncbi:MULTISPECIES: Gfo/Idh/MocA family protein [Pseudoalteromonas]|nr:Gfo/Idh/MocA family oxidoreductase [Pseudoalteromonas carrageenovora]MDO6465085.1 Gfo/Idh/MocA family oxidoreductase [Pseudoalteromonas carrageenovora]MDO6637025.1 Gfo/Idh/MocA family oxidoreductase [Pseudoalteromonas carrageenovora]MDO6649195.1 Gfo/Idh/MocA family oxidoreductase [Pseudoalteromonas carrageenovora]